MITVQSFDNLQIVAPETKILALRTLKGTLPELYIEIPSEIKPYFESFLKKAYDNVGADSIRIELNRDGSISTYLPIESTRFTISDISAHGEITYHEKVDEDPFGDKRICRVRDDRYHD